MIVPVFFFYSLSLSLAKFQQFVKLDLNEFNEIVKSQLRMQGPSLNWNKRSAVESLQ
jgi:hypothetical protein